MSPRAARADRTQAETLQRRREALLAAGGVMEVLRRHVDGEPPCDASCTLQDASPDRFVLRVEAVSERRHRATYAFKVYADDRGARLWDIAQALRAQAHSTARDCPVCLPLAYMPELGLTVYPWVQGKALRDAIRGGDSALLAQAAEKAASTLAWVHRACVPPEAPRTVHAALERAARRCAKFAGSPDAQALVRPLLAALEQAGPLLERSPATFVHGDPGPANLLFEGGRWRLIDLDRCGHADPASDVGYLLAQLTRRCLEQPALAPLAARAAATLEAAYRVQMPQVPARNIAFYYAATLAQKLWMSARERREAPLGAIGPLAQRALCALEKA